MLERARGTELIGAGRSAEQPELLRGPLVAEDQIIELELVDLTGVELTEADPDVLEQDPQLLLVVGANRFFAFSLSASVGPATTLKALPSPSSRPRRSDIPQTATRYNGTSERLSAVAEDQTGGSSVGRGFSHFARTVTSASV
jgi:hypothetical protein